MDDTLNPRATIGDNRPPPFDPERHAELVTRIDPFMKVCDAMRAAGEITSDDQAQRLADHIAGMRGLGKLVEETRIAEKKPHDEAAGAVQEAFKPLADRLTRAIAAMLALQTAWLDKKAQAAEAARLKREAEANELRAAAEKAAAAAAGSIDGELEAERLAKAADAAEKSAGRVEKVNVGSATGAGRTIAMRKVRKAEIINVNLLFVRYRSHPKLLEVLQQLADADVRAKAINEANAAFCGVIIKETRVAS